MPRDDGRVHRHRPAGRLGQPGDRGGQARRRSDLGLDGDARGGRALLRRHPQPGLPDGRAQAQPEAGRRAAPVRLRHGAVLLVADRGRRDLRARSRLLDLRGHPRRAEARGAGQPDDLLRRARVQLPVRGHVLAQGRPPARARGRREGARLLRAPEDHARPDGEDGRLRGHRGADRHRAGGRRHHAAPRSPARASGTAPPRSRSDCSSSSSPTRWASRTRAPSSARPCPRRSRRPSAARSSSHRASTAWWSC